MAHTLAKEEQKKIVEAFKAWREEKGAVLRTTEEKAAIKKKEVQKAINQRLKEIRAKKQVSLISRVRHGRPLPSRCVPY